MKLGFKKSFLKGVRKLNSKQQAQLKKRLDLFKFNPIDPSLKNHSLIGKYQHCSSINISGDIRAIYIIDENKNTIFIYIGTHSELYS